MSGFATQLGREIGEPVAQASARAGEAGGESMMAGFKGKMLAGAAAVGVAAGALVAAGLEQSMAKQKATGKLKAQLDLSAQDAKRAGAAAGKLFTDTVTESVEDGAAAVKAIMSAGLAPPKATTKQLAEIAAKAQGLTDLFEVDLAQGANAAGQAVKTGLAKNATEAFDVMYRGFQIMGPRADDFADTLNEYSTIFRSLNLPIKQVTGLLAQGMQAGARDTDTVADALKEFQIRATDGSDASADGFKALGLSAKATTAQIAAGGKGASDGLQSVLDRLRKMKDPVARNSAAVALFGTKAEDLGQALFALDPSKAVADLGAVGGAAKQAGKDLHGDAASQFEKFRRRALMTIGDAAAKYAIPGLMAFGRFLNADVLPAVKDTTEWIDRNLVPAVRATGSAFMSGARWVKEYGIWFTPLAILIGGVTLAMTANAIATGISLGVLGAYSIGVRGVMAVTRGWAAAQALFNAVMAVNPVTLIVIGVIALGAALVIAYKRSETFRSIVQGAWQGIQTAASYAWNSILRPAFAGFMTGMRATGDAAVWLWNTALKPTFGFISTAARILATVFTILVILPIVTGIKFLGSQFTWLWGAAIQPVIGWIVTGAGWLWSGVKTQFGYVTGGIRALGAVGLWLWRNAFSPVIGWIVGGTKLLWSGVKIQFGYVTSGIRALGATATWLWANAISPAINSIGAGARWLYDKGIKPPVNAAIGIAKSLGSAFKAGADAVGRAFSSIKEKAKAPVVFVIDTVYNQGIRGVWNEVADVFGAPMLPKFKGFARGGVLPGTSSWRQGDDQLVPMRRGEGVAVSEAMRDPYERSRLLAVNAAAMRGQSLRRFQAGEGFAKGGILDWVKGAASKGVDLAKSGVSWLKDGVKASAEAGLNAVVKPLIGKISGDPSVYRDMISGVPKKMISSILGFSGRADAALEKAGVGGPRFKSALSWARTQAGKPYQWAGNGDPSWDCSGFLSAIESKIRGQAPHRRWATGAFSGATAPPNWVRGARSPFMIGITNSGVGHTAGTINGVNVESRGGDGVLVGARARAYNSSLFTDTYGLRGFADGGRPRPGSWGVVGEQGPELIKFGGPSTVLDHGTSRALVGAALAAKRSATIPRSAPVPRPVAGGTRRPEAPAAAGPTYNLYPRTLDMTVRDLELLQRRQDAQARVGRPR
ncbi:phage tail tape measure protein [Streptomyces liangshanensis]|uniref:phage tail tape measure protein n=1 Tax=Streptomyces liangshanensis TaxID=2717324 RepID=UPI0036DE2D8B